MTDKNKDRKHYSTHSQPLSKESAKGHYETLSADDEKDPRDKQQDLVEARIQEAMADGAFDNLPGKGKPINLDKYYDVPEHLRLAYHMIKGSGFIPEEVRLKKEMETLKDKLKACQTDREKQELMKELNEVSRQYNFHMEYNKQFKKSF